MTRSIVALSLGAGLYLAIVAPANAGRNGGGFWRPGLAFGLGVGALALAPYYYPPPVYYPPPPVYYAPPQAYYQPPGYPPPPGYAPARPNYPPTGYPPPQGYAPPGYPPQAYARGYVSQ